MILLGGVGMMTSGNGGHIHLRQIGREPLDEFLQIQRTKRCLQRSLKDRCVSTICGI